MAESKYKSKMAYTGRDYLEMIDETIRLDIPILMVGSSSIGKSYSLTAMATSYGMHGEFLFIGSEKSEYIEGIPNLRASNAEADAKKLSKEEKKSGVGSSDEYKFTYLKPFWFPSYLEIRERLANGRDAFKKNNPTLSKNLDDYDVLATYKTTLNQTEASMKANADELYYISMLQGYGNYWLMLDEMDKVEKYDKDKFAPMLHIVRERQLKGWSMKGIDKYNEIKYVPSIKERQSRVNYAIDGMDKNGKPLPKGVDNITDVRIIAIANVSANITEPALVRRFVHFIVDKTLFLTDASSQTGTPLQKSGQWSDEDQESARKFLFHTCLKESRVPGGKITLGEQMAELTDMDLSEKLRELNLQWSLGFIPDYMFPMYMKGQKPSDYVRNRFVDSINSKSDKTKTHSYFTKILYDNFIRDLANTINGCVVDQFTGKEIAIDKIKETAINLLSPISPNKYNSIGGFDEKFRGITEQYRDAGVSISKSLGKKYNAQLKKGKSEEVESFLASEGEYAQLENWVQIGTKCVEITLQEGKATRLTYLLLVALPLIQKQIIAASPYIMQLEANGERFGILKQEQGKMGMIVLDSESEINMSESEEGPVRTKAIKETGESVATYMDESNDMLQWDGPLADYGYNDNFVRQASDSLEEYKQLAIKGEGYSKQAETFVKTAFKTYTGSISKLRIPVLINPLLVELAIEHPDEAEDYLETTADYLLVMKEIYGNLLEIISYYMTNAPKSIRGGEEIKWYIEKFPYRFKVFSDDSQLGPKLFAGDLDWVKEQVDDYIVLDSGVEFDKILNK